jgi:hypothetical protein
MSYNRSDIGVGYRGDIDRRARSYLTFPYVLVGFGFNSAVGHIMTVLKASFAWIPNS